MRGWEIEDVIWEIEDAVGMSLETCSDDAENRHRVGSWIVLGRIFLVGVPDDSRTVIPGIA